MVAEWLVASQPTKCIKIPCPSLYTSTAQQTTHTLWCAAKWNVLQYSHPIQRHVKNFLCKRCQELFSKLALFHSTCCRVTGFSFMECRYTYYTCMCCKLDNCCYPPYAVRIWKLGGLFPYKAMTFAVSSLVRTLEPRVHLYVLCHGISLWQNHVVAFIDWTFESFTKILWINFTRRFSSMLNSKTRVSSNHKLFVLLLLSEPSHVSQSPALDVTLVWACWNIAAR